MTAHQVKWSWRTLCLCFTVGPVGFSKPLLSGSISLLHLKVFTPVTPLALFSSQPRDIAFLLNTLQDFLRTWQSLLQRYNALILALVLDESASNFGFRESSELTTLWPLKYMLKLLCICSLIHNMYLCGQLLPFEHCCLNGLNAISIDQNLIVLDCQNGSCITVTLLAFIWSTVLHKFEMPLNLNL